MQRSRELTDTTFRGGGHLRHDKRPKLQRSSGLNHRRIVRRRGTLVRIKADPSEVITLEMPEWRIIDDETWLAVHEKFAARRRDTPASERTTELGRRLEISIGAACITRRRSRR